MNIALFMAGGSGKRFGSEKPKQFLEVFGKPLFIYALNTLEENSNIDKICFVCHQDYISYAKQKCEEYNINKVYCFAAGGDSYINSCLNGVEHIKNTLSRHDNIIIVAADRPFISNDEINDSIDVCTKFGCGVAAKDSDTCMFLVSDDRTKSSQYLREKILFVGTPWTFEAQTFLSALNDYRKGIIEAEPYPPAIYAAAGYIIHFSKMSNDNIKITNYKDLLLMKCILEDGGNN